jgi:hypothetical protein
MWKWMMIVCPKCNGIKSFKPVTPQMQECVSLVAENINPNSPVKYSKDSHPPEHSCACSKKVRRVR